MKRLIPSFLWAVGLCVAALQTPGNVGYVVDNGTGQVWVVDLARKQVDHSISTGASPAEMLILPSNVLGFVSNHDAGTVSVLDLRDGGSLRTTIQVSQGPGPGSLSCTPDGLFVFVANDTDNTVSVIDTTTLSVATTIPVGDTPIQVNVDPAGRFAYVVNQNDGTVSVIDINRNKVVKTLQAGSQPNQFAILPNLNTAYVVNKGSNDLTLVDLARNEVVGHVSVGGNPVSIAYSSDSTRLYVVNSGSNSVSVVNTATNQRILPDIPAGPQPAAMVVTYDSKFGYVSNGGSNTVSLLDLTTKTKELDIVVGVAPFSLMLDPNEDFLYVASIGSGSTPGRLTVIDVNRDQVVDPPHSDWRWKRARAVHDAQRSHPPRSGAQSRPEWQHGLPWRRRLPAKLTGPRLLRRAEPRHRGTGATRQPGTPGGSARVPRRRAWSWMSSIPTGILRSRLPCVPEFPRRGSIPGASWSWRVQPPRRVPLAVMRS